MKSELIKPTHLTRKAVVYIRQSTPHQVVSNQESLRLQYALRERARELGWHEADIDVIDADLGLSGASAAGRSGFKELVGRVSLSEVGLILSIHAARLASIVRTGIRFWTFAACAAASLLIETRLRPGKRQRPPPPRSEGNHFRARTPHHPQPLTAGLLAKAERGELALSLPIGLMRDPPAWWSSPRFVGSGASRTCVRDVPEVPHRAKVMRFSMSVPDLPRRDRHAICAGARDDLVGASILKTPPMPRLCLRDTHAYARSRSALKAKSPRPVDECIVVKDRYPTYITATYEKIAPSSEITGRVHAHQTQRASQRELLCTHRLCARCDIRCSSAIRRASTCAIICAPTRSATCQRAARELQAVRRLLTRCAAELDALSKLAAPSISDSALRASAERTSKESGMPPRCRTSVQSVTPTIVSSPRTRAPLEAR